ncbi:MAG: hypothetical protein A2126_01495 [Candidatus Woykebacteria bacterium GWB1_45_5]|uniref:Uncharacterized protein n=1 Tax=Candidatus Woykebacteria bacterium GWB1_45_5 TaxID=1802592 RepID=A0A1G1W2Y5_9BACT|nr:MAG: hypothetical protein A2126_01495 [Candidatus Woykebacteria bacterium GWB1_45_5]
MKTHYGYKKILFLATLVAGLLVVGAMSLYANTSENNDEPVKVKTEINTVVKDRSPEGSRISLSVDQSGSVKFGGAKFVSLSDLSISVTVSGLPLILVTNSSTQIVGVSDLGSINSGDILSGKGSIDQSTGVITLSLLRDESQSSIKIADLEKQIQALLEQLRKLQAEFKNIR